MKDINLNPGGFIGAITCAGFAVAVIYFFTGFYQAKLIFVGSLIGGAFVGNFAWERIAAALSAPGVNETSDPTSDGNEPRV